MKRTLLPLVAAALLAFGAHAENAAPIDEAAFVEDIEHAKALFGEGQATAAIEYWKGRRGKYAGRGGHYENELGKLYLQDSRYDLAASAFEEGIALGQKYPRLYVGLSLTYLAQNKFSAAEAWANRATEEFPRWWLGYYTHGQIEWKQDHFAAARTWLEKSISLKPDPVAFWLYGITAFESKDWESCVDAMKVAFERDPSYAQDLASVKMFSISLAQLGLHSEAIYAIEQYQPSDSDKEEVRAIRKILEAIKVNRNGP